MSASIPRRAPRDSSNRSNPSSRSRTRKSTPAARCCFPPEPRQGTARPLCDHQKRVKTLSRGVKRGAVCDSAMRRPNDWSICARRSVFFEDLYRYSRTIRWLPPQIRGPTDNRKNPFGMAGMDTFAWNMGWEDWAGNFCYLILAVSYLVTNLYWLRMLAILALGLEGIYFYCASTPPLWVGIAWAVIFVSINVVQIMLMTRERLLVRMSEREESAAPQTLPGNDFGRISSTFADRLLARNSE